MKHFTKKLVLLFMLIDYSLMLALESGCLPKMLGGVTISGTMPFATVITDGFKVFQSTEQSTLTISKQLFETS